MAANSGSFIHVLPLLMGDSPFARFLQFSDWIYDQTGMTGDLDLDRLFRLPCKLFAISSLLARIRTSFIPDNT